MRRLSRIFALSCSLLLSTLAMAQIPDTLWTHSYQGDVGHMEPTSVIATSDNGFAIGGTYSTNQEWSQDGQILKADSVGNMQWIRRTGGVWIDRFMGGTGTADGGYALCGSTMSFHDSGGLWVVKYNALGDTEWVWLHDYAQAFVIRQADQGDLALAGRRHGYPFLAKLTAAGDTVFTHQYPVPGNNRTDMADMIETEDHGYLLVCAHAVNTPPQWQYYLFMIRTDAAGDTLWTKLIAYPAERSVIAPRAVCRVDGDNFMIAVDYHTPSDSIYMQIGLIKINGQGDMLGFHPLEFQPMHRASEYGLTLVKDPRGGILLSAQMFHPSLWYVGLLCKVDVSGNLIWAGVYSNEPGSVYPISLDVMADGGYIWLMGMYSAYPWVVRLAPDSAQTVGPPEPLKPLSPMLRQNYPNPFNATTQIPFTLTHSQRLTLCVYDLLGKEVTRLCDGIFSAGEHQITFDASSLPSGMYIYRLQGKDCMQTRKMVLLK